MSEESNEKSCSDREKGGIERGVREASSEYDIFYDCNSVSDIELHKYGRLRKTEMDSIMQNMDDVDEFYRTLVEIRAITNRLREKLDSFRYTGDYLSNRKDYLNHKKSAKGKDLNVVTALAERYLESETIEYCGDRVDAALRTNDHLSCNIMKNFKSFPFKQSESMREPPIILSSYKPYELIIPIKVTSSRRKKSPQRSPQKSPRKGENVLSKVPCTGPFPMPQGTTHFKCSQVEYVMEKFYSCDSFYCSSCDTSEMISKHLASQNTTSAFLKAPMTRCTPIRPTPEEPKREISAIEAASCKTCGTQKCVCKGAPSTSQTNKCHLCQKPIEKCLCEKPQTSRTCKCGKQPSKCTCGRGREHKYVDLKLIDAADSALDSSNWNKYQCPGQLCSTCGSTLRKCACQKALPAEATKKSAQPIEPSHQLCNRCQMPLTKCVCKKAQAIQTDIAFTLCQRCMQMETLVERCNVCHKPYSQCCCRRAEAIPISAPIVQVCETCKEKVFVESGAQPIPCACQNTKVQTKKELEALLSASDSPFKKDILKCACDLNDVQEPPGPEPAPAPTPLPTIHSEEAVKPEPPPKPPRKMYRLAFPQHKDIEVCKKCRFEPSPLIDQDGRVFCPGNCGCCLCPWKPRATPSMEDLLKHTKIKVCKCRNRGSLFTDFASADSDCSQQSYFDVCPCREKAEARHLQLYGFEMWDTNEKLLQKFRGQEIHLRDVREIVAPKSPSQKFLSSKLYREKHMVDEQSQ